MRSACLAILAAQTGAMERRKPRKDAHPVKLSPDERGQLASLTSKGIVSARTMIRARVLQLLDEGWAPSDVPAAVGCGEATVRRVRARYEEGGLERALTDAPRPGHAKVLSDKQEAQIIAMVCSDPPDGHARWTTELVVEQAISRGMVDKVGRETIRVLLRHHHLRPWREKNVVRAHARRGVHAEDGGRARGIRAAS
jgi:putative transposase